MATIIKKCAHTPAQRRSCKCNWVVRYRANGRQREKSFLWNTKEAANTFALEVESKKRQGDYVDPKQASVKFAEAATKWLAKRRCADSTRKTYASLLDNHIIPAIGHMTLHAVSSRQGKEAVETFLTETMPANGIGIGRIRLTYTLIQAVANAAVRDGMVNKSFLGGIELDAKPVKTEFVFPSHGQLDEMAGKIPADYQLAIWLMRGCGLRIGEALGVSKDDFKADGTLRLHEQLTGAKAYAPLKHRKPGEYRDIPVPSYVAQMVAEHTAQDDGHLFAPIWHRAFGKWFTAARDAAGIADSFTPHSLRHVFASVALSRGVPITDVSKWLGHRDINITYGIYGHLVPSSFDRARNVLDAEYTEWSEQ